MFASNSAQQARLIHIELKLSAGSVALNTSSMYLGQAIGSAGGGWLIDQGRMDQLHWFAFSGVLLAIATSLLAARATSRFRKFQ
jgi:predicted MFS family arabinose efflux permease